MKPQRDETPALTVYYDGACPLCTREIAWYRRLRANAAIDWTDVSRCGDAGLPPGLSREQALARFHVRAADGSLRSGAAGFLALWARIAVLRPLAWLASVPPLPWLLERAYRAFLPLRPRLQRLARKSAAQQVDRAGPPD
jgi:predicted DCC family thiol-disulfide oxidoreductase YuxK